MVVQADSGSLRRQAPAAAEGKVVVSAAGSCEAASMRRRWSQGTACRARRR
jgi:hypothetical protein